MFPGEAAAPFEAAILFGIGRSASRQQLMCGPGKSHMTLTEIDRGVMDSCVAQMAEEKQKLHHL